MKIIGLGYPRSGNSWLKYIIQHLVLDCEYEKTHRLVKHPQADEKLLVIVRDYKECIPRHLESFKEQPVTIINNMKRMTETLGTQNPLSYIHPLHEYNEFKGSKLLIYYEDLISNPEKQILRLAKFLGVEKTTTYSNFIKELDRHKDVSIFDYGPGNSQTGGKQLDYHKSIFNQEQLFQIDEIFVNKYIKRYREKWWMRYCYDLGKWLIKLGSRK